MTDLSFIDNYAKIRRHLFDHGKTIEIEPKGPKVVIRRIEADYEKRRAAIRQAQHEVRLRQIDNAMALLDADDRQALTCSSCRAVLSEIATKHGVTVADIKGPSRVTVFVRARQEAAWRLREIGFSLPDIGRRLGGRDHTTALHAIRTHARRNGLPLTRGGADA